MTWRDDSDTYRPPPCMDNLDWTWRYSPHQHWWKPLVEFGRSRFHRRDEPRRVSILLDDWIEIHPRDWESFSSTWSSAEDSPGETVWRVIDGRAKTHTVYQLRWTRLKLMGKRRRRMRGFFKRSDALRSLIADEKARRRRVIDFNNNEWWTSLVSLFSTRSQLDHLVSREASCWIPWLWNLPKESKALKIKASPAETDTMYRKNDWFFC